MKDYTLSQKYALIALDGLESIHASVAKKAAVRGIFAAKWLEQFFLEKENINSEDLKEKLETLTQKINGMKKAKRKETEREMAALLTADGAMEVTPALLACDMTYSEGGVDLKDYRANADFYLRITEELRAEALEAGVLTKECVCLLWLFRESGCLHDIFSVREQEQISARMLTLTATEEVYKVLWEEEFHSNLEHAVMGFLETKNRFFKNPYMEGVNLLFPFLNRRAAVFVDFVVLGTNVQSRRIAMMNYLTEKGHYVEDVQNGTETLLKIDNSYYRIWPKTISVYRVPVQGAQLQPVYQ